MADAYDAVRRPEHATRGNAWERYDRDPDAFTAGAQYALDRVTGSMLGRSHAIAKHIAATAATILTRIHEGRL